MHQLLGIRQPVRRLLRLRRRARQRRPEGAVALPAAEPRAPHAHARGERFLPQRRHALLRRPGPHARRAREGTRALRVHRRGRDHRGAGPAEGPGHLGGTAELLRTPRPRERLRDPRRAGHRRLAVRTRRRDAEVRHPGQRAAAHQPARGAVLPLHRGQRPRQAAAGRGPGARHRARSTAAAPTCRPAATWPASTRASTRSAACTRRRRTRCCAVRWRSSTTSASGCRRA
ncbi:MAG: hypothetical protein MZW92_29835 [Comamonadaceae bacterium]|nr:hypothetical protein [Comamonadaceae bacterium]